MHIKHNLFYILLKEKKLFQKSKQNEHFLWTPLNQDTDTCQKNIFFSFFGTKHISIMRDDLVDTPQWAPLKCNGDSIVILWKSSSSFTTM